VAQQGQGQQQGAPQGLRAMLGAQTPPELHADLDALDAAFAKSADSANNAATLAQQAQQAAQQAQADQQASRQALGTFLTRVQGKYGGAAPAAGAQPAAGQPGQAQPQAQQGQAQPQAGPKP
jgi:hypothetical protein